MNDYHLEVNKNRIIKIKRSCGLGVGQLLIESGGRLNVHT